MPFPDAVQGFSVQTSMNSYAVRWIPRGAVNIVTMSEINNFHGVLFEFIRNYAVNAANYFATTVDTLKRNQCGGTLGTDRKEQAFLFWRISGDDHAHRSTYHEVLHVSKGHILKTVGNETFDTKEGDTINIPAGLLHSAKDLGIDSAILSISFSSADRQQIGETP